MKHLLLQLLLSVVTALAPLLSDGQSARAQTTADSTRVWDPNNDPNFNPDDPSTWPPEYRNLPEVEPNGENVGDDNTGGSSSFGSYVGQASKTYADKVKSEVESLIGEWEDQILGGLTDALENWLLSQLQNLLGASPIRSVESLKKLLKDAYSKQQKIDYQQLKVDFAEQKGNTELSAGFGNYYQALHLKEYAKVVEGVLDEVAQMAGNKVFTGAERAQLTTAATAIGDMRDIINEVKFATNQSKTTAYMAEADRIQLLDDNLKAIQVRIRRAQGLKKRVKAVLAYRLNDARRGQTYDDLLGDETATGNGLPRVRRAR